MISNFQSELKNTETELKKILKDMKNSNSAIREDAYARWVKLVELNPKVATDEQKKKIVEALKHYQ